MKNGGLFLVSFLLVIFTSSCAGNISEVITSEPFGADIYWGKNQSSLTKTGHKTTYSRPLSGSRLKSWCYQVKKAGYHNSEIICRSKGDGYRHVHFQLEPVRTVINSKPSGADICWGPSTDQLELTIYKTPRIEKNDRVGASWKDWYFQIKKEGFYDSEIVFRRGSSKDRFVHVDLKPIARSDTKGKVQVTLAWKDNSTNELGFKIERKTGSKGMYKQIATVGPNVTSYTDTVLSPSTTYYYRVRAYNSAGYSAYSKEVGFKTSAK